MKKTILTILIMVMVALLAIPSFAFDGKRKGFILGGGLGFGSTSFSQTVELGGLSVTGDTESSGAIMSDFKIGFGASEQLEIYYVSKVAWFGVVDLYNNEITVSSGVGTFGLTYNLKPTVPTYYISGGLGISSWSFPFEDPAPDSWLGFGMFVGGGYEFSRHYSVSLDILYGNPSDSEGALTASASVTSVKLTINALAY
ncbi:MAG: hypothetical protein V3W18_07610 [candidate division Zixibacteria bacterium]